MNSDRLCDLITVCLENHPVTHTFLWSVCMLAWSLSAVPPTWMEPGPVHSTAVSFERSKTKSLKSKDLPLSCVHLIPLFFASLSLRSAPWPEAAGGYRAAAALEAQRCFQDASAWEFGAFYINQNQLNGNDHNLRILIFHWDSLCNILLVLIVRLYSPHNLCYVKLQ